MDRDLLVVFDDLELRMLHAEPVLAQAWLTENHQPLAGRDHFLDVMQVEPAQHQRLAERVRIRFFQGRFKDFFPPAESNQPCLDDFAADQDWRLAFLTRESSEMRPVFVTPRIMR